MTDQRFDSGPANGIEEDSLADARRYLASIGRNNLTDITRVPCSRKECVTMFTEEMPWLNGRDLQLVMGRAVCDWLGGTCPTDLTTSLPTGMAGRT